MHRLVSNIASNAVLSAVNKFERIMIRKQAVREDKRFTLFILNEDTKATNKIIISLEHMGVLIDSVTERVNHEIKNKKADFLVLN